MANIREIALNIIIEYYRDGTRKPSLLKDSLEKYDYLETRDKAFIKRVVDGCIERQIQIDYLIDSFAKTKVKDMQPFIRGLMRMSVYQIMFMDQVPDSAACNEAVKLAARHRFATLKGFVNAVLRNISRNKDEVVYPDREADGGTRFLSIYYSMPEWICRMWLDEYGFERTEKMLEFFLLPRPTTVKATLAGVYGSDLDEAKRDQRIKSIVSDLKRDLEGAGCRVSCSDVLPYALNLEKTDNIRFLPGYDEGRFLVQDVSSMLVTHIADPGSDQEVLDVCAAPGGKSLDAAERAKIVLSRDVSERKCDIIRENAARLKLTNLKTQVHDARIHDRKMENSADIIYLDLPCSGLGIIGRKNDIKFNVSKEALEDLSKLQWEIIKTVWDYVKVGGIMMYSTCTVNRAENKDMIDRICRELPFEMVDFSDLLPEALQKDTGEGSLLDTAGKGYIQLLPGEYDTDGFFIAKLRRIG